MAKLHYNIILNNNVEFMFDKLFASSEYEEWTKAFAEHNTMTGSLAKGEVVHFYDGNKNGMKAKVTEYDINKLIEFTYLSEISDGVETIFEDESNYERYIFTSLQDEMVKIEVQLDIPEQYFEMMEDMWAKAVDLIHDVFDNDDDDAIA